MNLRVFKGVELGEFDGTTLVLLVSPQFTLWESPVKDMIERKLSQILGYDICIRL